MTHTSQQPQPHPAAPYYPAPAYAPPPPKNLTVFAWLAFATAALATLFDLGTALVSGRAYRYIDDPDQLDWSLAAYVVGGLLSLGMQVAGWVTASLWLHQARKNAELINPSAPHARSAGWAWGGWVCPVVAFWFPFQVVRDVKRAVSYREGTGLVGWWWGFFVVWGLSSWILSLATSDAGADEAAGVQQGSIFVSVLMIVVLVLWGRVLLTITRAQHAAIYGGARTS